MADLPVIDAAEPRSDWLELLRAAAARETIAGAAERVGLSRATVSLLLAGKYPAKSLIHVERKVRAALDRWWCPYLDRTISAQDCRAYHDRPAPRSSSREIKHWQACQQCIHSNTIGGK
ncbi:MAG: LacI family transcriptional regulator [Candidatus Competibacter sp.]|nr:LacI family transcriptional regulator [Candidatus Competibacter sp.]MDG4583370.1 LacI family transcriptional regulator [Candidatus Competibacter sp.]